LGLDSEELQRSKRPDLLAQWQQDHASWSSISFEYSAAISHLLESHPIT
jgi:hypothetical protein